MKMRTSEAASSFWSLNNSMSCTCVFLCVCVCVCRYVHDMQCLKEEMNL